MYSRPAVGSEYIRPAGSAGCSMLCCSLPCGRREWRELRHNWNNFISPFLWTPVWHVKQRSHHSVYISNLKVLSHVCYFSGLLWSAWMFCLLFATNVHWNILWNIFSKCNFSLKYIYNVLNNHITVYSHVSGHSIYCFIPTCCKSQYNYELTHRGQDEIGVILQKTLSNAFFWMKMYWFR